MNIAALLQNKKSHPNASLPLPLAPVFCLPAQQWYFSSPTLVPLRKRPQNTCLYRFLGGQQHIENLKEIERREKEYVVIGMTEPVNYLQRSLSKLVKNQQNQRQNAQLHCFTPETSKFHQCLKLANKKNKRDEVELNAPAFTNRVLHSQSIDPEGLQLRLIRLPCPKGEVPQIIKAFWNGKVVKFDCEELTVNQHMRNRAKQLCQVLEPLINQLICQTHSRADQHVQEQDQSLFDVRCFTVWFFKNTRNNELYLLSVSHLQLQGFNGQLFPVPNLHCPTAHNDQNLEHVREGYETIIRKERSDSLRDQEADQRKILRVQERLRQQLEQWKNTKEDKNDKKVIEKDDQIKQCECCRAILDTGELGAEIAGRHIEGIRYLRQIKIGRKEHSPYDFAKVCDKCYQVYLNNRKKPIRAVSKVLTIAKQVQSVPDDRVVQKPKQGYKYRTMSSQHLDATSEGRHSKESSRGKRLLFNRERKHNTTYTTNTQVTIIPRQDPFNQPNHNQIFIMDDLPPPLIPRPIRHSNRQFNQRPQTSGNLLNKLIANEPNESHQILQAAEQYEERREKQSRPSLGRLLRQKAPVYSIERNRTEQSKRRGSVHSFM